MKIRWIGHASFHIETSNGLRIRTDPYDGIGLPLSELPADVVTVSHEHRDHSSVLTVPGNPVVLRGPVHEVIRNAKFRGIETFHDDVRGAKRGANTVFVMIMDGLTVVHLGDLGDLLTHAQVDALGEVDVLCIPVGGNYTLDAAKATELIAEIEPTIVLPMHYRTPGLTVKIDTLDAFLTDKENVRDADELELTAANMPDRREVVILKPRP